MFDVINGAFARATVQPAASKRSVHHGSGTRNTRDVNQERKEERKIAVTASTALKTTKVATLVRLTHRTQLKYEVLASCPACNYMYSCRKRVQLVVCRKLLLGERAQLVVHWQLLGSCSRT